MQSAISFGADRLDYGCELSSNRFHPLHAARWRSTHGEISKHLKTAGRFAFGRLGIRRAPLPADCRRARVEALSRFAAERGRSPLELSIGWLLSAPCVPSVIAGA